MTPEAATLRDVAIALGVDPSGDVLAVARQAAAAAREVDTALLVLAAVDEPAEPLVAAVRRLLRERDEARRDVEHIHAESVRRGNVLHSVREAMAGGPEGDGDRTLAERAARIVRERDEARASLLRIAQHIGFVDGDGTEERIIGAIDRLAGVRAAIGEQDVRGFDRAINALRHALSGKRVDTGRRDADRALERVASLVGAEVDRAKCCAETEADAARLRAAIRVAVPAIRAGLDAGGDHALYRERIAAGDALRTLADAGEGGESPAAVLSAAELEAVRERLIDRARGCFEYLGGYSGAELEAFHAGIGTVVRAMERADTTQTRALEAMGRDVGRPLAGEESEG